MMNLKLWIPASLVCAWTLAACDFGTKSNEALNDQVIDDLDQDNGGFSMSESFLEAEQADVTVLETDMAAEDADPSRDTAGRLERLGELRSVRACVAEQLADFQHGTGRGLWKVLGRHDGQAYGKAIMHFKDSEDTLKGKALIKFGRPNGRQRNVFFGKWVAHEEGAATRTVGVLKGFYGRGHFVGVALNAEGQYVASIAGRYEAVDGERYDGVAKFRWTMAARETIGAAARQCLAEDDVESRLDDQGVLREETTEAP